MNWIDRIFDLLHLLWFEVTQVIRNIWRGVRVPFWIYLLAVVLLIGVTIASSVVIIGGVVFESNWTIFWGGIILLGLIVLVGVVLIPGVLGVNVVRAIFTRLGGKP